MAFSIREAQPKDAAQMIAFVQRLAEEPGINIIIGPGEFNLTVEEEQKILADSAAADNSTYLVAETGGEIIGAIICAGGRRRATRHMVNLSMSVDKAWRNRGVGTALMERAIAWAKSTGVVKRIELEVFTRNEVAIHLYGKYGFQVEGRRRKAIYRDGEYIDNLMMGLLLWSEGADG